LHTSVETEEVSFMPVDVKPSQVQDLSKVKRTFTLGKGTKNE